MNVIMRKKSAKLTPSEYRRKENGTIDCQAPHSPPRRPPSQNKYKKLAMEDDQNAKSMRCIYAAKRDRRNAQ